MSVYYDELILVTFIIKISQIPDSTNRYKGISRNPSRILSIDNS